MTPLRLIQVGMGGWGRDWAKMMRRHSELVETVACVDVEPAMLRQLSSDVGVAAGVCYGSLEAALEATDADAVLVTTALGGHVPVALAALAAGKHVLVEKPFAPTLAEARQVVETAAEQGRVLMVSQNYRFFPAVQAAATLIREGRLGSVDSVSVQFRKYSNTAPREGNRHYTLRHPLLIDMSIHHFDLMRYVLGQEPQRVSCHAWNPPWSRFDDAATASATIQFDGGAVVDYHGSWVSTGVPTTWAGAWEIECADGVVAWTSRDDSGATSDVVTVRMRGKRPRRIDLPELPFIDRAGSLAAFAAAIRDGAEPSCSGQDNIHSLALMFAAIAAAESGQPQTVASTEPRLSAAV